MIYEITSLTSRGNFKQYQASESRARKEKRAWLKVVFEACVLHRDVFYESVSHSGGGRLVRTTV